MRAHGSYVKYTIEGCRCDPCRQAASDYEKARQKRLAMERWHPERAKWVDAEPVRQHVRSLMAGKKGSNRGMGWKRIAEQAGVPTGTLWKLLYGPKDRGPSKRIRSDNAAKLLAVEPNLADGAKVPAGPTWRLVNEIVSHHDQEVGTVTGRGGKRPYGGGVWLARQLTGPQANALQLSRRWVSVRHARKVKEIHDRLFTESEAFRWRYCNCPDSQHPRQRQTA